MRNKKNNLSLPSLIWRPDCHFIYYTQKKEKKIRGHCGVVDLPLASYPVIPSLIPGLSSLWDETKLSGPISIHDLSCWCNFNHTLTPIQKKKKKFEVVRKFCLKQPLYPFLKYVVLSDNTVQTLYNTSHYNRFGYNKVRLWFPYLFNHGI